MEFCSIVYTDELYHHGIKGMHWGVRRYQNEDGSLTSKGREQMRNWKRKEVQRRTKGYAKIEKKLLKRQTKLSNKKDKKILKGKDTAKVDNKIKQNTANLKINKAFEKAEVKKIKGMKIADIQHSKRAKAAFATKTALKYVGKTALAAGVAGTGIGIGVATSVAGVAGATASTAATGAGIGITTSIGGAAGGGYGLARSTKTLATSKRHFSNLTEAEKAKIYKRYYRK